jgi:hypothetical protein
MKLWSTISDLSFTSHQWNRNTSPIVLPAPDTLENVGWITKPVGGARSSSRLLGNKDIMISLIVMDSFTPYCKGPQSLAKTEIPHSYPGWSQTRHLLCPRHNLWGLEPIVAGGALPLLKNKIPD